jgi:hypothetical protein
MKKRPVVNTTLLSIPPAQFGIVVLAVALGAAWIALDGQGLFVEPFTSVWPLFLLGAVVGEMLVVDTPRGRPMPASLAILAALALLGAAPWEVCGLALVAWCIGAFLLAARGERADLPDFAHRVVVAWALPGLAAIGTAIVPLGFVGPTGDEVAVGAILTVTGGLLVAPAAWAFGVENPMAFFTRAKGLMNESVWAGVAIGSSGALVAVSYPLLGAGALLLLLLPILAARAGLHHYVDIRRTYDQTIVAMSRLTELTGHVAEGHGVRVGRVAVDIARRIGLTEREVHAVERIAHLHEVGRIATDDPDVRAQDRDVALAGAEIVREAGSMPDVAEAIERLRDPYRRPGERVDETLPIGARIVRTVCEYDRLLSDGKEPWSAIDSLHRAMAYDHDPVIVALLTESVNGVRPHARAARR